MANSVRSLLNEKGGAVWTIAPQATVLMALQSMAEKDVGALLVVEGDNFVGIITERDYARKCILKGKESKSTAVSEIMSTKIITVTPDDSIEDCMVKMKEHNIRHLPVIDGGRLAGVVSMKDVVSKIISKQSSTISSLENYISGTGYGATI